MAGRLEDAEALANHALDLGVQIGDPDAFTFFAGQYFVIGTFAGRHDDLFPLVEQAARDNPGILPFEIAYAIISAAVGATETAQAFLDQGMAQGFEGLPVDNIWTTSVIGYAVIALELEDADAAAQLLPIITPLASTVSFNGLTSQGPISAYVGKLASLVGEHALAEDHLRGALETATTFGWSYHRATTLIALAEARHRRLCGLDDDARTWLADAADLCRTGGFTSWLPKIDGLVGDRERLRDKYIG
jgi:hypothetical protein